MTYSSVCCVGSWNLRPAKGAAILCLPDPSHRSPLRVSRGNEPGVVPSDDPPSGVADPGALAPLASSSSAALHRPPQNGRSAKDTGAKTVSQRADRWYKEENTASDLEL